MPLKNSNKSINENHEFWIIVITINDLVIKISKNKKICIKGEKFKIKIQIKIIVKIDKMFMKINNFDLFIVNEIY